MFIGLYIVLCLFIIQTTYCDVMSKEDVLQIQLKRTHLKKCPSYSDGYINFSCQYRFFCRGDICSTKNKKTSLVEFKDTNGKTVTFIPDTCIEEDFNNNLCQTAKCYENSDCLSNKCINRTCIVNDDNPIVQCINLERYSTFKFKYTGKMNCGRNENEKCEVNEDCASKNCTDTGHCLYYFVDHKLDQIFYQVFEIGILVFILVLIFLLICCIACCCIRKKRKSKYSI